MRLILHTLFVFSAREPCQLSLTYSYLLGTKVTLSVKKTNKSINMIACC